MLLTPSNSMIKKERLIVKALIKAIVRVALEMNDACLIRSVAMLYKRTVSPRLPVSVANFSKFSRCT